MHRTIPMLIVACLLSGSARAQIYDPNQGCFIDASGHCARGPTPGPYQTLPPPPRPVEPAGPWMFCYSDGPVSGTRNLIFTNIFATPDSPDTVAQQLADYEHQGGVNLTFTCDVSDSRPEQAAKYNQRIAFASQRGFNINFVRHR